MLSIGIFHNFAEWENVRKRKKNLNTISFLFSHFFLFFSFLTQVTMCLKLAWNLQCSLKLPWTLNSSVSTPYCWDYRPGPFHSRCTCSAGDRTQGLFHAGSELFQLSYIPMYPFIQQYITNVTKLLIVGIDKRGVINLCMPRNKNNFYSLIMVIEYNLNILDMK